MGDLVTLSDERDRREREREVARSQHPALRWVAGTAFYVAHRKVDGAAACGADGSLTLAPPGVPRCVECFPPVERIPRQAAQ